MKYTHSVETSATKQPNVKYDSSGLTMFKSIVGRNFKQTVNNAQERLQAKRPKYRELWSAEVKNIGTKALNFSDLKQWTTQEEGIQDPVYTPKIVRNILRDRKCYRSHFVPKHGTDEMREVQAPIHQLKTLQKLLLQHLYKVSPTTERYSHGFEPKRGNWSAACDLATWMKPKKRWAVLTQDLKSAFSSVTRDQVKRVLSESQLEGYPLYIATAIATHDNILSTGSPASPFILNILLREIDTKLGRWAEQRGGMYRRYADDMTVALPTWRSKDLKRVREMMRRLFAELGIALHPRKSQIVRLGLDSDSVEVIGIAVQPNRATRPRRLRRKLRGKIRATLAALKAGDERGSDKHYATVCGLVAYFSGETENMRAARTRRLTKFNFSSA